MTYECINKNHRLKYKYHKIGVDIIFLELLLHRQISHIYKEMMNIMDELASHLIDLIVFVTYECIDKYHIF